MISIGLRLNPRTPSTSLVEGVLDLAWREMLKVLGERKRKRKLQVIPDAVANWLKGKPVTNPT